jgi:2,3-bisphosphoglycerate-independent phosphoglycerate mutase
MKKFVVIVPDGAADRHRVAGRTPLAAAATPAMDHVARAGVSGLMRTLHPDLPRESLVAQMGMLGWDPHVYYPGGRASSELLRRGDVGVREGDLVFRANLVRMEGRTLASYNADYIHDDEAVLLVGRVRDALRTEFPEVELHHCSDFRTVLVYRGAGVRPGQLCCREPHENHGAAFPPHRLVEAADPSAAGVAARLNGFLERVFVLLRGERANALLPWSPSTALRLPSFAEGTGRTGRTAILGAMDFLGGLAAAGSLEFHPVGNGRPETDYAGKGARAVRLLAEGCEFLYVHVNAPDEAAHMHDPELKVRCLERTDREVVRPIVEYFHTRPAELGALMVVPDHYSNSSPHYAGAARSAIHSLDPVPFAIWNGRDRDAVESFDEQAAREGRYGSADLDHLDLLPLLGYSAGRAAVGAAPEPAGRGAV